MLEARVTDSLADVDRDDWNALFPGEVEDYDYLRAVESAGLEGFGWRYVLAEDDQGLVAAAPGFVADYALATTVDGAARTAIQLLGRVAPGMTRMRMACLGSPCTETAQIGWSPRVVEAGARDTMTRRMLAAFEAAASVERRGLLAIKDVPLPQSGAWTAVLAECGYTAVEGLATADLVIDFATIEDYLAGLSSATRKDMRRKLRDARDVRIEVRDEIGGLEERVMALYAATRARGELQFETLTSGYFTGVLSRMRQRAACVLYFVGDELLAANLILFGDGVLLDKFFCMSAAGRSHNLYFLSWFTNLQLCLDRGLTRYRSGQAAYANKLRLGSRLTPTTLYFRHRNGLVNQILRGLSPLLAPGEATG